GSENDPRVANERDETLRHESPLLIPFSWVPRDACSRPTGPTGGRSGWRVDPPCSARARLAGIIGSSSAPLSTSPAATAIAAIASFPQLSRIRNVHRAPFSRGRASSRRRPPASADSDFERLRPRRAGGPARYAARS